MSAQGVTRGVAVITSENAIHLFPWRYEVQLQQYPVNLFWLES